MISTDKYLISGNHPHHGDLCYLDIDKDKKIEYITFGEVKSYKVILIDCEHGGIDGCFVPARNLVIVERHCNP